MGQWMDVIGENKTECKLCSSNHLGPWKSCSVGVRTSLPCAWIGDPMLWRRLKTLLGVQNSLLCMNRTKARFFEIGDRLVEMCRNFSPVLSKLIKKHFYSALLHLFITIIHKSKDHATMSEPFNSCFATHWNIQMIPRVRIFDLLQMKKSPYSLWT